MRIDDMTAGDVDAVTRLIDQLYDDRPGVVDPARVRQGWRTFVARDDAGEEAFYERCGFTRGGGSWLAWVATAPGP